MKSESIAFGIAGVVVRPDRRLDYRQPAGRPCGSRRAAPRRPARRRRRPGRAAPPLLDETKVKAYKSVAEREPSNATPRVELGNLYFDAERYDDAIKWYGEALKLEPNDVNVSTDLGVSLLLH